MITITDGLITVSISNSMLWTDELQYDNVVQTQEPTITGKVIIEPWELQGARPITLEPPFDDMCWIKRDQWKILRAWANIAGKELTLTFKDATTYTVIFGRPALQPKPVAGFSGREDSEYWRGIIRFITVEA